MDSQAKATSILGNMVRRYYGDGLAPDVFASLTARIAARLEAMSGDPDLRRAAGGTIDAARATLKDLVRLYGADALGEQRFLSLTRRLRELLTDLETGDACPAGFGLLGRVAVTFTRHRHLSVIEGGRAANPQQGV